MHQYDLSRLRSKGLHYLTPEQLAGIGGFLNRAAPILQGDWNSLGLGQMFNRMSIGIGMLAASPVAAPQAGANMIEELDRATQMLSGSLASPDAYRFPWDDAFGSTAGLSMLACRPLVTDDGKQGFVLLKLAAADKDSFDPHTKGLEALREVVAQAKARHADVRIGLTGLPVMENDEMRSSQTSMTWAGILSFVGVALVFLLGFGGWRHPLIGNVALMAGMAWAFGFATLAVGHLNILSSAFGAILIGQGIDFGVYYLAGYLHQRGRTCTSGDALLETAGAVGPGIATGAISTAIAFFAAGFAEFVGVAELGVIAGGGILLCFVAATVLLPAMIQLFDAGRPPSSMPRQLELGSSLNRIHSWPVIPAMLLVSVSAVAGVGLRYLRYDHNLMNLQPLGLESVQLAKSLVERTGQTAYFAVSMASNREEALVRKEALLRQPSVLRVDEISSVLPGVDPRRQSLIEQIHAGLSALPSAAPQLAVVGAQDLDNVLARLQMLLPAQPELNEILRRIQGAREALRSLHPAEIGNRIGQFQQRLAADTLERLTMLQSVSDPNPPQWSDLPNGLTTRFVGQSGKQLLKVFSRADIWDMPATDQFIQEVRSVDPDATGNPMQIYEASRQMKRSYEHAAIYAAVIVAMVVYLDFGSVRYTLLALVPLGLGMMQMFGVMGLLDMPLNAANMIVLPLMLGIGVDNGVHVVHDYRRQQRGKYRLSNSTANAVFINSLGNMVGFGSLMIANHQGLQSLGRVLTIGMACCVVSALTLPSLLTLFDRRGLNNPTIVDADAHARPLAVSRLPRRQHRNVAR
jgi:hopanoid biosynthesis associated RND transporter like protein HpnN